MRDPKRLTTKFHPACQMDGEAQERIFCLRRKKVAVGNATVASLQRNKSLSRVSMHTENWSLVVSGPSITSPQPGRCAIRNEECCTQRILITLCFYREMLIVLVRCLAVTSLLEGRM